MGRVAQVQVQILDLPPLLRLRPTLDPGSPAPNPAKQQRNLQAAGLDQQVRHKRGPRALKRLTRPIQMDLPKRMLRG